MEKGGWGISEFTLAAPVLVEQVVGRAGLQSRTFFYQLAIVLMPALKQAAGIMKNVPKVWR